MSRDYVQGGMSGDGFYGFAFDPAWSNVPPGIEPQKKSREDFS